MTTLDVLRKRAHLTQQQLADTIGVNRVTVARWESDGSSARRPDTFALRAIAEALRVSGDEIEFADRESKP